MKNDLILNDACIGSLKKLKEEIPFETVFKSDMSL